MEAAASPLPSDETTPPVTKMYFTGLARSVCGMCALRSGRLRQVCRTALQILRGIDPDGVRGGFDRADSESVFEGAKLLEALGPLERRRRQSGQAQQELAPVDVQARCASRTWVAAGPVRTMWQGSPAEVQRITPRVDDDLDHRRPRTSAAS